MQYTCSWEKKACPLWGNKFPIAHFYAFSLCPWFIAFAQLQHDKGFSFQHKMIFQAPLNIFVRQGQPTKLNCQHKDPLLFNAGERLQGIITLSKKIFQLRNHCLFLQYLWLCANLSPTLHGFSFSLSIYWKAWQMSISSVTGHPGLFSYCYRELEIRTFTGDLHVLFLWFLLLCFHLNHQAFLL